MNAPVRHPRKTTSDRIDQSKPAYKIVQKAGGLTKFCNDFDFPTSTVHSWLLRGFVPSRTRDDPELGRVSYTAFIIHRGKQLDPAVEYTAEEFIEPEAVD